MNHTRRIRVAEGENRLYNSVEEFKKVNPWVTEIDVYLQETEQSYFWVLSNTKKHLYLIVKYLNEEHKQAMKPIWRPIEKKYLPNLHNGWGNHKSGDGKGKHFKDTKYRKDYLELRAVGEASNDPDWITYTNIFL